LNLVRPFAGRGGSLVSVKRSNSVPPWLEEDDDDVLVDDVLVTVLPELDFETV
jgi:hypothetical protein